MLAWLVARAPLADLVLAGRRGPGLALLGFAAAQLLISFLTDLWATWIGLRSIGIARPLRELWFVRAATHLVGLVNFTLGQGALGVYLARSGCSVLEASLATFHLVAVSFATLCLLGGVGSGLGPAAAWPSWLLATPALALALALLTLAVGPKAIRRRVPAAWRERLSPLPLLAAIGARALNFAVFIGLYWLALRLWGFDLPILQGIPIVLALMLVAALPVTPYGVGTVQLGQVLLLSPYASGGGPAEREAFVLAFGLIHQVASVATQAAIGLAGAATWRRRLPAAMGSRGEAAGGRRE